MREQAGLNSKRYQVPSPRSSMRNPPRMTDIAARAGVSRMAVSAVLMGTGSGRIGVSAVTADRIRQIAQELGYRPNAAAQQLAGKRSGVIAVIAHDWKNFLAQRALAWLHEAAEGHGFRILATRAPDSLGPIEQLLRDVQAGWIDGIVYLAHENESQWKPAAELLKQTSAAVTVVGDLRIPGMTSIISDVTSGARASISHLKDRGRKNPILITEEIESSSIQARIAAYCSAAAEHGMQFNRDRVLRETEGWFVTKPEYFARFERLAQSIKDDLRADSVLCDTDFTAVGLLRAFRRLGIRVPEDISVIGWGDLQFAAVFDPCITTVSHQLPELLTVAVEQLDQQIETDAAPGTIELLETQLVVRETS
ncbi:MAG: degA [Planctomycetaceae bacterium]|nr:degA [Planctomycetaceae bacterium]